MPRVSLILAVKNGMPFLPEAIESVRAQTYRDFELIVQDGASTDGTLEYLRTVDDLPLDLVSEDDSGHGDAYNRALRRVRGDIVGTIDADNLLEAASLADAVSRIDANQGCGAIYGAVRLVTHDRAPIATFTPGEWHLERFMRAELVPPFSTGYFVREVCGDALRFDDAIAWCQDYDLWLRLSGVPILRTEAVLGITRLSDQSLTCRPENYDQFCSEKIGALERFLERIGQDSFPPGIRERSKAGIYCWAAESILELEGSSDRFARYLSEARRLDPQSARVAGLDARGESPHVTGLPVEPVGQRSRSWFQRLLAKH